MKEMKQVSAALRIFMENQELLCSVLVEDHFREELADVIITALSAAGYLGIDIDKAVQEKMEINRGRDQKSAPIKTNECCISGEYTSGWLQRGRER